MAGITMTLNCHKCTKETSHELIGQGIASAETIKGLWECPKCKLQSEREVLRHNFQT